MSRALIGHTGFVGGTLSAQTEFEYQFNSKNIEQIGERPYELVVCAGAPAAKWIANQQPDEDLRNLERLIGQLKSVQTDRFVLISTVDVYRDPVGVDESTPIDSECIDPYGRHRFYLEEFVRRHFEKHHVLRLPGLFGTGLKKNFIFDLLHGNALDWTHKDSVFQWYDMSLLWRDIGSVIGADLPLVNFAAEPVPCDEVARKCFDIEFSNVTAKPPVRYDMRTLYAHALGGSGAYLTSAEDTYRRIGAFVASARAEGA